MKKIYSGIVRLFNSDFLNPKYAVLDVAVLFVVLVNVKFH